MDHHFMMWSIALWRRVLNTHTQQEMEQGDHTNSVIVLIVIIVLYEGNVEILNTRLRSRYRSISA